MSFIKLKYITQTPLWRIQKQDDEYLAITLPVAIFGMLNTMFYVIIALTAWFNHELVIRVQQSPARLNLVLENNFYLIPISILASLTVILLFYIFSETFNNYNFFSEFNFQVSLLQETLDVDLSSNDQIPKNAKVELLKELFIVFSLGLVAGIYYSLIYSVIYLFIYLFFIFVLVNFMTLASAVTSSMLLSWFILAIYAAQKKLITEEIPTRFLDPQADYAFSDRAVEILLSDEAPIICMGCKSYIASNSKLCGVCGDIVDN